MKHLNLLVLIALIGTFSSCVATNCIEAVGEQTTITLPIPDFSGIDASVNAKITITQGNTQKVIAKGSSNIIEKIRTSVNSKGVWDISFGNGCYRDYDLEIDITVPNISSVEISGSGRVLVNDFTGQSDLSIGLSGSSRIELNKFEGTENLSIGISGSGKVTCNADFPDLDNLKVGVSGSGAYHGFPITTNTCKASISGSGKLHTHVNNTLKASISGSGKVYYKGNPTITRNISGSGRLIDSN